MHTSSTSLFRPAGVIAVTSLALSSPLFAATDKSDAFPTFDSYIKISGQAASIKGDGAAYQSRYRQDENVGAGIEDFHYNRDLSKESTMTLDGRALTTDTPPRDKTSYQAQDQDLTIRAFRDETVEAIGKKNLVDVRSPDEFSGKLLAPAHLPQEQSQRAGHIPTALNVPWSKAANDDGTFKSDADLAELYKEAGLDTSKQTIAYCRIGERSSHTWFALHELLGEKDVKNYDGSWTEYGSLVGVPVEKDV